MSLDQQPHMSQQQYHQQPQHQQQQQYHQQTPQQQQGGPALQHPSVPPPATVSYHASFRASPAGDLTPPTGLSILMSSSLNNGHGGGGITSTTAIVHQHHDHASNAASTAQQQHNAANLTSEQKESLHRDHQDRERQASALAAAGMVAERNNMSLHQPPPVRGLLPPPSLGNPHLNAHAVPSFMALGGGAMTNHQTVMTPSIISSDPNVANVSYYPVAPGTVPSFGGGNCSANDAISPDHMLFRPPTMQEMEMDFAKMFDPAMEIENMQTAGSGWPTLGAGDGALSSGVGGAASPVTYESGSASAI